MEADTGGVRKHVEDKELVAALCDCVGVGERAGGVRSVEGSVVRPLLLPPQFDGLGKCRRVTVGRIVGAVCGVVGLAHTAPEPTGSLDSRPCSVRVGQPFDADVFPRLG